MVHFLVFRPLRNAAPLGKVIGSVGVLLYLQGVAQMHFGGTGRQPESIIPDEPLQNFLNLGSAVPQQHAVGGGHRPGHRHRAVGPVPVHPLRAGDPGRGRQREGRRPARLLAAAPGRHQLGDRRRHRRLLGDRRRSAAGLAHPDRAQRARRRRPRRRAASVGCGRSSSPRSAASLLGAVAGPAAVLVQRVLVPELLPHRRARGGAAARHRRRAVRARQVAARCGARSRRSGCRCHRTRCGSGSTPWCGASS